MLQSIPQSNLGHRVFHLFSERADSWGQWLNPSIAHFVQSRRVLPIRCPGPAADTVFETTSSIGTLPHVIDPSTIRLHVDRTLVRVARSMPNLDAVLHCALGDGCELKIWGRMWPEDPAKRKPSVGYAVCATTPALFSVMFWEISRSSGGALPALMAALKEKDDRIRKLEMQVALSMCAQ